MGLHVAVEVELGAELLLADIALELSDTVVVVKVLGQVARLGEGCCTSIEMAFEWSLAGVNA